VKAAGLPETPSRRALGVIGAKYLRVSTGPTDIEKPTNPRRGRKRVNCRSFRRQLLTDPQRLTAAHQAHAAKCAPCARALRRAQAFEACLYSALLLECAAGGDRAWEPVVARGVHREP